MARLSISILSAFLFSGLGAFAETRNHAATNSEASQPIREPFDKGSHELQLAGGFFISENYFDLYRPQMNDIDVTGRFGWMLYDPCGPWIFRGNLEVVAELFAGGFVKGPADVIAGTTVFLRYNYVQPSAKIIPYVQVGGGGAYSDASESHPQRELGAAVSFNLQAGFGTRFMVNEKCALFLEIDYRHLSNASLADRNVGLNSGGSWLGASFFF